jgi:dephospho-CoA kinase
MIIAITGYIGSGKTTVANMFRDLGYRVVDVDKIGHELVEQEEISRKIVTAFGLGVANENLVIDRDKLGSYVFNNPVQLRLLNRIVHPYIINKIYESVKDSYENTILDVALFEELGLGKFAHKTILVKAYKKNIFKRKEIKYSKKQLENIIKSQRIPENPDFIIENNGSMHDLKKQVVDIYKRLR